MGWRYLVNFADERQVKPHTVATYMRRYPEKFEGHTRMDGKKMLIDEVAEEILSEIYRPLPPEKDWKGLQQERDYYLKMYIQGSQKNEMLMGRIDEMRDWELKFKTLETSYQLQLAAESGKVADEAVKEALKAADEKKQLELQLKQQEIDQLKEVIEQMKSDHQAEIRDMSFGKWLKRNKE